MQYVKARKMKSEARTLNRNEQTIKFYRDNPIFAAIDILGVNPVWFQRVQLRELWNKPYCLMKWGRGTSKSWSVALYVALRAMLFPDSQIGIIAPSFRQTGYVFDYIDKLFLNSSYFRACVRQTKRTTETMAYILHNGSRIEGLPIGQDGSKIRGRRYNIVILDEYSYHNEETIKMVVRPFLVTQKGYKPNQIIICSTPSYKTNHFYPQCKRFKNKSYTDPLYSYTSFNFLDVILANDPEYRMDMNYIYEQYEDQTQDQFLMEYAGYFPNEGSGFFTANLIASCQPRNIPIEIESYGESGAEYVMGIDPARAEDGDNSSICILKLKAGNIRHLVRLISCKGKTFPEQIDLIREQIHVRRFNIVKICMDDGGGGLALRDLLQQVWNPEIGHYPPIVETKSVGPDFNYRKVLPILDLINFNTTSIEHMYTSLRADMEHRKILIPLSVMRDPDPETQRVGREIGALEMEMHHITPKPMTRGLNFIAHPKLGKDRITSFVLANLAANKYYRIEIDKEPDTVSEIFEAFWLEG